MSPRGTLLSFEQSASQKSEATLSDVLYDVWCARWYVIVASAIGVLCAALVMFLATPYYKAQIVISPANPMNGAESSSLLANDNLFALRFMLQRMGGSGSSDFMQFETLYSGPSVAAVLIKDEQILRGASMDIPFGFLKSETQWNTEKLAAYIEGHVYLESVGVGSLKRMVYWHPNAEFAAYLLERLHGVTDTMIRDRIRTESGERIDYLRRAVIETNNPEHRRALTTLLMEQERLRMLVSIDQPYAAAVVEPAAASHKTEWPNPLLLFGVFILAGALIGFVVYGVRYGF